MKKIIALALAVLGLASCTVNVSEHERYILRYNAFYEILTDSEKALFADGKFDELGAEIDSREKNSAEVAERLKAVRIEEAIMTYHGDDTARYFYEYILREINRENFYSLMKLLTADEQALFVRDSAGFIALCEGKQKTDSKLARLLEDMTENEGLYGFSTTQAVDFLRNVVFAELSQKEVYSLLELLSTAKLYTNFIAGDLETVTVSLAEAGKSYTQYETAKNFSDLKARTGLSAVSDLVFLELFYTVVMVEMDTDALSKTLSKF